MALSLTLEFFSLESKLRDGDYTLKAWINVKFQVVFVTDGSGCGGGGGVCVHNLLAWLSVI